MKHSDKVLLSDGTLCEVERISCKKLSEPEITYNLEVADFHTYYVADAGVLVHNECNVVAKVHGKAHGSTSHKARIMQEVGIMQKSGKYTDIYLNKALKTVGLHGSQRPDIIGKLANGTFEVLEVASKSQTTASLAGRQLVAKMALMGANNPGVILRNIIWLFG